MLCHFAKHTVTIKYNNSCQSWQAKKLNWYACKNGMHQKINPSLPKPQKRSSIIMMIAIIDLDRSWSSFPGHSWSFLEVVHHSWQLFITCTLLRVQNLFYCSTSRCLLLAEGEVYTEEGCCTLLRVQNLFYCSTSGCLLLAEGEVYTEEGCCTLLRVQNLSYITSTRCLTVVDHF